MNNTKAGLWFGLIFGGLSLTYSIFMLLYLQNAKKCDPKLSDRDRRFRQAAVVITWIAAILGGLNLIGILVALLSSPSMTYVSMSTPSPKMEF